MSQVSAWPSALPSSLPSLTPYPAGAYHTQILLVSCIVLKALVPSFNLGLLGCKRNQKSREAWLLYLLLHPVLVLSWGSLHVFGRRDDGTDGRQASVSPQVGLALTETFGIGTTKGDFLPLWRQNYQCLHPELHLCPETGLPVALPCLLEHPSQPPPLHASSRLQGISD